MPHNSRDKHGQLAVLSVFFLSGAAALIYEISWSRQIGIYFGHTVHAASITLASFFAGMTLGYLAAARLAGRIQPLVGYAVAELVAAIWALLLPLAIQLFDHPSIQSQIQSSALSALAIRAIVCFLLLLPATTALGATLPFMSEYMSPRRKLNPGRVSFAYGLNTTGALAGVISGTYLLLAWAGVVNSSRVAAGLSTLCGIMALLLSRYDAGSQTADVNSSRSENRQASPPIADRKWEPWHWYGIAALSGFVTMGLQVAYVRMFALVFHNSSYTFGAVIAIFLAALALGSFLVAKLQAWYSAATMAGWSSAIGAGLVGVSPVIFVRATGLEFFDYGETFFQHIVGALFVVAYVVLAPIIALGTLLPLCWKAAAQASNDSPGRSVGNMAAVNTIFAAAGALVASFMLLPIFGLWTTVAILATIAATPACFLLLKQLNQLLIAASLVIVSIAWGTYTGHSAPTLGEGIPAKVVRSWESPYGLIDVIASTQGPRFLVLRENIHYQHGDTGPSRNREYRQGNLPLLLHPSPQRVLFLGLGTGLTAAAAVHHPEVEQIDVVELIPEVAEASKMFGEWNRNLLQDPRTQLHIDDARHYLRSAPQSFDLIVSDLFVLWQSQTGYLYTREHYETALAHLNDDGIYCQWVGLYQLGPTEFEMIANTFASVFPHTSLWWGRVSQGMVALVGSKQPLSLSGAEIQQRLATLPDANRQSPDFDPYLENVPGIFRLYIGDWTAKEQALLNTDEHPRIEFQMPVTYRNQGLLKANRLLNYFDSTLSKLPQNNVIFRPAQGDVLEPPSQRLKMQRSVIARPRS